MHWDDLRYVLAVHASSSVATAAGQLGVSNVTVFRRLKALEKQLGVRLFDRTRKGYVATAPGLEIVRQAERIQQEIGVLERRVWRQDKELSGVVRITAPDSTGTFVVAPLIGALHKVHPKIRVELKLDNRVFNISKRDADIAIRPTTSPPENLIGHRLASLAHAPYAAARLLPRGKRRRLDPADLADLPWVGLDDTYTGHLMSAYQRYLDAHARPDRIVLRVNSTLGMALAVRDGVGAGVVSCVGAAYLGGLVRLGPAIDALQTDLWILTHPELREVARVASVYAFLREEITRMRPLFAGDDVATRRA
ncbi:MAG: LysR family transcriptional regulator [Chromatiales bacterium]|nr:LysR family transcriptional regulator [Chromatiales bacterium]